MADKRYQAGIIHGIASSRTPGSWPEEIKGLGRVHGGRPIGHCTRCPPSTHPATASTFVQYGGVYFCKNCARLESKARAVLPLFHVAPTPAEVQK